MAGRKTVKDLPSKKRGGWWGEGWRKDTLGTLSSISLCVMLTIVLLLDEILEGFFIYLP